MYNLKTPYGSYNVVLEWGNYSNGRRAIELLDAVEGDPVCVATVNLPDIPLGDNEAIIKDYSENEGVLKFLQDYGIVGEVKRWAITGFVECPIVDIL